MSITEEIRRLWIERGGSNYGGEAVTQLEHALQAAHFAREAGADDSLVAAALLHDIGHVLHDLPDDAPDEGIDDRHEAVGDNWLRKHFPPDVTEPVRLHVAAKRYLCSTDPDYRDLLSEPSILSLKLQGGPMSEAEVREFEALPHYRAAVDLRRWDDRAKIPDFETDGLDSFMECVERAWQKGQSAA